MLRICKGLDTALTVEKRITDLIRAGIGWRISRTKDYRFRVLPSAIVLVA